MKKRQAKKNKRKKIMAAFGYKSCQVRKWIAVKGKKFARILALKKLIYGKDIRMPEPPDFMAMLDRKHVGSDTKNDMVDAFHFQIAAYQKYAGPEDYHKQYMNGF